MEHTMSLYPAPFSKIKSGVKTIELRLYDEKRRKVAVGDTILFYNTENSGESVLTKVTNLYVFSSFDELYESLPLLECGYTESDIQNASPRDMDEYYSVERQEKYGVVGIRVAVI